MTRFTIAAAVCLLLLCGSSLAGDQPCVGDCGGDGAVAVSEIVTCVNIALLRAPLATCADCDGDGNQSVEIHELIQSIRVALEIVVPPECASRRCIGTGGSVAVALCCLATGPFPDTCAIGACSCAPENSHEVAVCDCGEGGCFNGLECVLAAERACLDSGGIVTSGLCCNSVGDFPDTCAIGACSCPPQDSHEVQLCDCGRERCWDGATCTEP